MCGLLRLGILADQAQGIGNPRESRHAELVMAIGPADEAANVLGHGFGIVQLREKHVEAELRYSHLPPNPMGITGAIPPALICSIHLKPSLSMCLRAPKPPRFVRLELDDLCGTTS